jgi:hypothetical protein
MRHKPREPSRQQSQQAPRKAIRRSSNYHRIYEPIVASKGFFRILVDRSETGSHERVDGRELG